MNTFKPRSFVAGGARYLHPLAVKYSPNLKKVKILDAAGGNGTLLPLLKTKFPASTFVLLDKDKQALEEAKGYEDKVCASVTNIPFPDCFFDYAFCIQSLNYVANWRHAILELDRVSKNGFTVTVPNAWFIKLRKPKTWFKQDKSNYCTPQNLKRFLKQMDFEFNRVFVSNSFPKLRSNFLFASEAIFIVKKRSQ